jgi:hypothetical protein
LFPGDFNIACSILLDGNLAESHCGDISWNPNLEDLIVPEKARVLLTTAITGLGSNELFEAVLGGEGRFSTQQLNMTELYTLGLEVVDIKLPTAEAIEVYDSQNNTNKKVNLKPLGKLICKHWEIPTFEDHDLPEHLCNETFHDAPETYTFWLESDILEQVFMEMKLSAEVRRLEVQGCKESLWILDGINSMYCSFYSLILNDLMYRPFKEPRWLTEEGQAAEAAGDDLSD